MGVDKVEDWIFSATYNELKIDEKALKKEEAKKEEPKKEEPKKEEPKPEEPKPEVKKEEPKKEEPAKERKDSEQAARDAIVKKLTEEINKGWGFLAEDINDILVSRPMRSFMLQRLHNGLFEPMMETVEKFSKEFANTQVSVDETMKKMAAAVFAEAYKLYDSYKGNKNKSVPIYAAVQKVANIVMSEFSPAAFDEKYEEYADSYVLRDDELISDTVETVTGRIANRDYVEEAREELDAYPREKVEVKEEIPAKPEPVVEEPVVEEPKVEETVVEEPEKEPVVEEPVVEEPVVEEPVVEEPVVEEPKVEAAPIEEPKVEEPKVEEAPVEEPAAEEVAEEATEAAE
jgi:hypothetical protein